MPDFGLFFILFIIIWAISQRPSIQIQAKSITLSHFHHSSANTEIAVTTGSDSGEMLDTVVFYVYGDAGKVGPIQLGSGQDGLFQPGVTDEFKVCIQNYYGTYRMVLHMDLWDYLKVTYMTF